MTKTVLVLSRGIAEIDPSKHQPYEVYHEGNVLEKDVEDLSVGDAVLVAKTWTSGDYDTLVGRLLERCPRFAELYFTVYTSNRKPRWADAIASIPQQSVPSEGASLEQRLSAYLAEEQEHRKEHGETTISREPRTIHDWIEGMVMAPSHREVVEALLPLAGSLSYFLDHWTTIETLRLAQSVGSSLAHGIRGRGFLRWKKHQTEGAHRQERTTTQLATTEYDEVLLHEILDYVRLTTGEQISREFETAVIEEIIPCSEGQHLPRQLQERRILTVVPNFPKWAPRRSYREINLERSILQELTKKIIIPYLQQKARKELLAYGSPDRNYIAMLGLLSWNAFLASYSFVGKPAMHTLRINEISLEHISELSPGEVAEIRRIYRHIAKTTADDVRTGALDSFYAAQPEAISPQDGVRSVVSFMRRWGRTTDHPALHEGDTARLLLHYNKAQSAMPACFWEYQTLYGLQQLWQGNAEGVTLEEGGIGNLRNMRRAIRVQFERALRRYARQELGSEFNPEKLSMRLGNLEHRLAERYGIAPALDTPPLYGEHDIKRTLQRYKLEGFRGRLQPSMHAAIL